MVIDPAHWARTAIWWSVYPLGACGAPIREADSPGPHHRLRLLEDWLDHLVGLGCNGLALGPIWASTGHGYDVIDHRRIDSRLGGNADFDHLVAACHARGVRVLLDGVFNHVASEHRWVVAARAGGKDAPIRKLLRQDTKRPDGLSRFEGHDGLVELNHLNPVVVDDVVETMIHWLDRGADGWRLDAAYRVPRGFWTRVLPRVRAVHPEALIVAEVLHGDYATIAEQSGFDSVTQYELWKAIWSSLNDRNPHELLWTLERHAAMSSRLLGWTFVGNHDVTRIASQVPLPAARIAWAILMTLPGLPALYYGDEYGWVGVKQECLGGDDAIRPELPHYPPSLDAEAAETLRLTRQAIQLRRTHPWLVDGSVQVIECTQLCLTWRTVAADGRWLQATLDLASDPHLVISDPTGDLLDW